MANGGNEELSAYGAKKNALLGFKMNPLLSLQGKSDPNVRWMNVVLHLTLKVTQSVVRVQGIYQNLAVPF